MRRAGRTAGEPAEARRSALDGVDLSSLSRGERLVMLGGGLLFLDGFVPWWFRVRSAEATYTYPASLTGLGLAATLLGAAAAGAVVVRAWRFPRRGPADGLAYAATGLASAGLLVADVARGSPAWIGLWIGLALSAFTAGAGVLRRAERRAGWI